MEAQVHIMKEEQANLFALPQRNKTRVINPEETVHLEIEDDAVRCAIGEISGNLDGLERQMTRSIARLRQGHGKTVWLKYEQWQRVYWKLIFR